jgi:Protein of unknown function (DUF2946)
VTSWIAVLAILMTALAPTVSHALSTKAAPVLTRVCSLFGLKWAKTDGQPVKTARQSI